MQFLHNLKLAHKFTLIGALALIMVAVPATLAVKADMDHVTAVRAEQSGLLPAARALKTTQSVQQHRGLSALVLGGHAASAAARDAKRAEVDQSIAALRSALQALGSQQMVASVEQVERHWADLTLALQAGRLTGAESFGRHTALVAQLLDLLEGVADHSGITLDPEPAGYFLGQAVLTHTPRLAESLGQLRGRGAGVLAAGAASEEERARLAALVQDARANARGVHNALRKAANADPLMLRSTESASAAALAGADQATRLVEEQLLKTAAAPLAPDGYMRDMTRHIDAQYGLIEQAFAALSTNLDTRAASATRKLVFVVGLLALLGLACAWLVTSMARNTMRAVTSAAHVARHVADGDLRTTIEPWTQDELGQLLRSLKDMTQGLTRLADHVREGSESVSTASTQIAQGNLSLSQRTEEQASALEQTAATMIQLGATVRNNADNAHQADQLARTASNVAADCGGVVSQVVATMSEIQGVTQRVSQIIGVIDSIAFQTNILALNAAVEAARAGEQGRGFSIVAAEVRALAQRSATAAREIKALMGTSVDRVEKGTALVGQAGETMKQVVTSIERVTALVSEISAASSEQSASIGQVEQAVTQLDQVTQQNAALVEQSAAAAESLRDQAQRLKQTASAFRTAERTAASPAL